MIDKLIKKCHNEIDKYTKSREEAILKSSRARIKERKTVWWVISIRSDEKINVYQEILQDLEKLKEKIYQNLCGQYKYIYDKLEDFTEVANGVFQCKADEEVFYQNDRFDGRIYNLTFLNIVGVDTDE